MVKSLVQNFFTWQFIKYVVVGFLGTALDFSLLYILVEYGHLWYFSAAFISISIVLWISFSLNKYWTFKNYEKKYFVQLGKYLLSHLLALGLSLSILAILVEIFQFWYILAKFFATVVAAITNFLMVKKYIFF
ncbi:MAG: GtrA family protein [Patescibacteria group bacterium]